MYGPTFNVDSSDESPTNGWSSDAVTTDGYLGCRQLDGKSLEGKNDRQIIEYKLNRRVGFVHNGRFEREILHRSFDDRDRSA